MLNIFGSSSGKLCDGVSRRDFLRVGALGMGGLALPQLLAAEALAGIGKSHKAVIMIYLVGAPPHQDMFDLKMNAPSEVRGPFRPIKTNVPGGGHDATSRRLEWQVVGVDPGFDHDVALNIVGQTVNLRDKTYNPAGNTYSTVKTVTVP